jgi:hypothetical protein
LPLPPLLVLLTAALVVEVEAPLEAPTPVVVVPLLPPTTDDELLPPEPPEPARAWAELWPQCAPHPG